MHSYPVELSRGIAFHNIITSIIHEHQVDIPAAMKWLEVFGRDTVVTFLTGINALPSWGPEIDDKVQQYINDIGYIVRGTDTWCYRSEILGRKRKGSREDPNSDALLGTKSTRPVDQGRTRSCHGTLFIIFIY